MTFTVLLPKQGSEAFAYRRVLGEQYTNAAATSLTGFATLARPVSSPHRVFRRWSGVVRACGRSGSGDSGWSPASLCSRTILGLATVNVNF